MGDQALDFEPGNQALAETSSKRFELAALALRRIHDTMPPDREPSSAELTTMISPFFIPSTQHVLTK